MAFTEKKKSFFGKLSERISDAVTGKSEIDEDFYDELEEILITSDIGMETTMHTVEKLRAFAEGGNIKKTSTILMKLKDIIVSLMDKGERQKLTDETPLVLLVIGVNGGGKTTSIGKISNMLKNEGKTVILAAADTFRAAAVEQLAEWANRAQVDIIKGVEGQDPASVVYDGVCSAKAKNADILFVDTAGRLHNKKNLMMELAKIDRVLTRELPDSSRETLLVLDSTTGQNAVIQAKEFKESAEITGLILTKLDGTAKGGAVFSIKNMLDIPVKYIGVGEGIADMQPFDADMFVDALFS